MKMFNYNVLKNGKVIAYKFQCIIMFGKYLDIL